MAETKGLCLTDVDAIHMAGENVSHDLQQFMLAFAVQFRFQFVGFVEVIFDGALAATGDENQFGDACSQCLFNCILNQGFVHHRHHFFGRCLGGRQKTGTQTCDGKYGLADGFVHVRLLSLILVGWY